MRYSFQQKKNVNGWTKMSDKNRESKVAYVD